MTIAVEPSRASRIRALHNKFPFVSDAQLALILRDQGLQVLASDVRVALGNRRKPRTKSHMR